MEYLYIVGIVGYYIYKAYSSNKKKQQEKAETIPSAQESPKQKKKKGFFDEFLEELEKQQADSQPQAAPVNREITATNREETISNREQKIEPRKDIAAKNPPKKSVSAITDRHAKPLNKHFEMPKNEMEEEIANTDIKSLLEKTNNSSSKTGFAGMNMSPKEALKAQIILERKY